MSALSPGLRLADRFVLDERIGTGGMSQVWRATDEVLDRTVAVKMLTATVAGDPALREATWREARASARLTHPNVARVYDYGEAPLPDGAQAPYLVMELVEGRSLAAELAGGPLPWQQAAMRGAEVAAALASAHQVGVVHQDIKPGNVMLTPQGARVLDFGIAALVDTAGEQVLVGTPSYVAPERLQHAPADPTGDVYSLGVLLYELLTGHPPARLATWPEAAAAHQQGVTPPPLAVPGLPAAVAELVTACLSRDPAQRPPARQAAAALASAAHSPDPAATLPADPPTAVAPLRYAVGSAALPRQSPAPDTAAPDTAAPAAPPRRGRLLLIGAVVAAVVLGASLALAIAALQRPAPPPGNAGSTPGSATSTAAPTGASTPAAPPDPAPSDGAGVANELDRLITESLATGAIDQETADDLRDELADLRETADPDRPPGRQRQEARDTAEDIREEIADLRDDGQLPPELADQLENQLQPLLTGGG